MKKKSAMKAVSDTRSAVRRMCQRLLAADALDTAKLDSGTVPLLRGIYVWRCEDGESAAYVGVALGKRGLRGRIIEQHLRPSYEQSVFRKAVVRPVGVDSREGSVDYIKGHFTISLAACPDEELAVIFAAEALVLAALRPRFNKIKGLKADIQDSQDEPAGQVDRAGLTSFREK